MFLATLLATYPASLPAQTLATVAADRNVLQGKVAHGDTNRPAIAGTAVRAGDTVTSGRGMILLHLHDGSALTLGAEARATPEAPDTIAVASGAVRLSSRGAMTLRTPAATVAASGTTAELLVGAPAALALRRNAGLTAALGCAAGATCVDAAAATIVLLRGPGPARTDGTPAGTLRVTAAGRTVAMDRAGVVVVGAADRPPSAPLPLSPLLAQQFALSLDTYPVPQEQRAVVDEIAAALSRAGRAAPALGRVVLDYGDDPVSTQAALARVAGAAPSPLLVRLALAVLAASDVPAAGVLADALSQPAALPLLAQVPAGGPPALEEAVARLIGPPAPPR